MSVPIIYNSHIHTLSHRYTYFISITDLYKQPLPIHLYLKRILYVRHSQIFSCICTRSIGTYTHTHTWEESVSGATQTFWVSSNFDKINGWEAALLNFPKESRKSQTSQKMPTKKPDSKEPGFFVRIAGTGFEPMTFGLWAQRATGLLHPAPIDHR